MIQVLPMVPLLLLEPNWMAKTLILPLGLHFMKDLILLIPIFLYLKEIMANTLAILVKHSLLNQLDIKD